MSDWNFPNRAVGEIDYSMTITMSADEAMESALSNRWFTPGVPWLFFRLDETDEQAQARKEEQERKRELNKLSDRDYLIHKGYAEDAVDEFLARRKKKREELEVWKAEQDRINALWRNRVKRAWAEAKDRVSAAYRVLLRGGECDFCDEF